MSSFVCALLDVFCGLSLLIESMIAALQSRYIHYAL